MKIEHLNENGIDLAVISSDEAVITGVQSALDLMMSVKYETGAERIVIPKELICEEFFILSTGIAGEILQKFINYHVKAAIYGDYSHYTSKPLKDRPPSPQPITLDSTAASTSNNANTRILEFISLRLVFMPTPAKNTGVNTM